MTIFRSAGAFISFVDATRSQADKDKSNATPGESEICSLVTEANSEYLSTAPRCNPRM